MQRSAGGEPVSPHRQHRGREWAQWRPSQAAHVLGQDVGDSWVVASAINNFGELARYRRDYDTAVQFYRESQELFRQINSAVALFAAVYARFDQPGTTLWPADRADVERQLTAVRAQLDETVFTAAWAHGQAMPFDQAVALAWLPA